MAKHEGFYIYHRSYLLYMAKHEGFYIYHRSYLLWPQDGTALLKGLVAGELPSVVGTSLFFLLQRVFVAYERHGGYSDFCCCQFLGGDV